MATATFVKNLVVQEDEATTATFEVFRLSKEVEIEPSDWAELMALLFGQPPTHTSDLLAVSHRPDTVPDHLPGTVTWALENENGGNLGRPIGLGWMHADKVTAEEIFQAEGFEVVR